MSSTDQVEKYKIEHLLLLVEWPAAGFFGLEKEVCIYGFNLSFFVICVNVVELFSFDKILKAIYVKICHEAKLQAFIKL